MRPFFCKTRLSGRFPGSRIVIQRVAGLIQVNQPYFLPHHLGGDAQLRVKDCVN
jgi:hypothetical protein